MCCISIWCITIWAFLKPTSSLTPSVYLMAWPLSLWLLYLRVLDNLQKTHFLFSETIFYYSTKMKSGTRNASYLATVAALVEAHVVQAVRVDPVLEGQVVVRTGYQFLLLTYNYKIQDVPSSILDQTGSGKEFETTCCFKTCWILLWHISE